MSLWRCCASLGLAALFLTACTSPSPGPTATREVAPTRTPALASGATLSPAATPNALAENLLSEDFDRKASEYLAKLVQDISPRESATSQELQAAWYLAKEFESFGYSTKIHEFNVAMVTPESSSLAVVPPPLGSIAVAPLRGSAVAEGTGPLIDVGLARTGNITAGPLSGRVALVQRGEITFQAKVEAVAQAGAVAAVIYNHEPGNFRGSLRGRSAIPAVSISKADGEELLELLSQGEVQAKVSVQEAKLPSRNLIAELSGGQEKVVVLGAHYDTVADTQGANDNTSGLAALLILAEELASRDLPFRVRFIAFGAEEIGLFGSRAYTDSLTDAEIDEIAAMVNYDALGAGGSITLEGSVRLSRSAASIAESNNITVSEGDETGRGTSDHASFARYDIPALLFTAPDYSRINSPEDVLEFVEPDLVGDAVRLTLLLLESGGFPP